MPQNKVRMARVSLHMDVLKKRKEHMMTTKPGIPYQVHEDLDEHDDRGALIFGCVRGEKDPCSVWYHTFTRHQHYYYICNHMRIIAVCGCEDIAMSLYRSLEVGELSRESIPPVAVETA